MNTGAYILVVFGILLAKALGFLRDIVFASSFGASQLTDIYFQIFGVTSLIFTGIGSALSTLVIKNLNKADISSPKEQKEYVSYFISKVSLILVAVLAVVFVFSESAVKLLLPGLDPSLYQTAVSIMRIMLPSCLFVVVAYIISGVLQNSKVFFVTSIMSLPYNVLIIFALIFKEIDIFAVSIITTVGWFLHIVILLPSFYKKGYRLFGSLKLKPGGKNHEVLYIFIGSMMFQLCFTIDKAALSHHGGMASTVNYASNLFITISSVFVVAMSNVSYPSICRHYESGNGDFVRKFLGYIITLLFAIFVPFILVANLFGKDIISLLYERGEFGSELTSITSSLFAIYTFGIFGYVCQELFNKILYLGSKYFYPVFGTVAVVLLKLIINIFAPSFGAEAVAVSTTALFTLYAVGVSIIMAKVVGNYFSKTLLQNILKILLSALCAFLVYLIPLNLHFIIRLVICGAVYIAALTLSGCTKYIITNTGEVNKK